VLALRGRLVLVGLLGGRTSELAVYELMRRRARLIGSVLRPRPREEKARLVRDFADFGLPRLADGRLQRGRRSGDAVRRDRRGLRRAGARRGSGKIVPHAELGL
jgi:NADPH:quinone reductase-like Zn-dependent oxidoreductase